MSSRTVKWTSCVNLACTSCVSVKNPDVVLVVDAALAADPNTDFGFLDAKISNKKCLSKKCGCGCKSATTYIYDVAYDDDDLADDVTELIAEDVETVLCKGGLLAYIDSKVTSAQALSEEYHQDAGGLDIQDDPDGTTYDFELELTNPSETHACKAMVVWGWGVYVQATDEFNVVALASSFYIDNVLQTGFAPGSFSMRHAADDQPIIAQWSAPGNAKNITLSPGQTVTARLHIEKSVGSPVPNEAFSIQHLHINAFGVVV